jgi:integrin alpha 8
METAAVVFNADNKLISLEDRNCTVRGVGVTCTTIKYCLKYNGKNVPMNLVLDVSWVLDSKKTRNPRMFFKHEETKNIRNSTVNLSRGKEQCNQYDVYIADGIRDKLTPLEVEMRYNLREATTTYALSSAPRRKRGELDPILDQDRGTIQKDTINIQKNCGSDNVCIPDLKLEVK